MAEAGFFPGIIFYLTYWYPAPQRARAYARFLAAIPVCGVIGGPLSGALLGLDGRLGLRGWLARDTDRCNLAQCFQHERALQIMAAVREVE